MIRPEKNLHKLWLGAILLLLLAGCFLLTACSDSSNPAAERARRLRKIQGPITLGIAGYLPEKQSQLARGAKLAAREIEARGGVLGHKLQLIFANDNSSAAQGLQIAQNFADNPRICAVIGHTDSYVSIPASILYQYYGILMLSPLSTSCQLTDRHFSLVFTMTPNARKYGKALADFCLQHDLKRALILQVNNAYGNSMANHFEDMCQQLGIYIVDRTAYDPFSNDIIIKNQLKFWRQHYLFDVIFIVSDMPRAARIVVFARELGISATILGSDSFDDPDLLHIAGRAAEGVVVPSIFSLRQKNPRIKSFAEKFISAYGVAPDFVASQGYDALNLLAQAITQAGTTDPAVIAQTLKRKEGWQGLTHFSFNPDGSIRDRKIFFQTVKNGKFVLLPEERGSHTSRKGGETINASGRNAKTLPRREERSK